ncbi:hypothetical protein BST45_20115, partial [Mycobacterium shinjukuense]
GGAPGRGAPRAGPRGSNLSPGAGGGGGGAGGGGGGWAEGMVELRDRFSGQTRELAVGAALASDIATALSERS